MESGLSLTGSGPQGRFYGPNGKLLVEKTKKEQLPGAQLQRNGRLSQLEAPDSVWHGCWWVRRSWGLSLQEKGLESLPYDGKGAVSNPDLL